MFKENFVRICAEKGLSPTAVCTAIGLSNSTYSQWSKDSIPRKTTLLKLAEYLDVSVEELVANPNQNEKNLPSPAQSLNETEAELVKAFRAAAPETQDAVLRVLQIDMGRTQRKDA